MNRRGFFGGLVAAVAGLFHKSEAESYTYTWSDPLDSRSVVRPHWTDDPRYKDVPIPYGAGPGLNRVWLDGRSVERDYKILRLKSGPDGWIEYRVDDEGGGPQFVEEVVNLDTGKVWGPDDPDHPRFCTYRPDPEGGPPITVVTTRYRLVTAKLFGNVCYKYEGV